MKERSQAAVRCDGSFKTATSAAGCAFGHIAMAETRQILVCRNLRAVNARKRPAWRLGQAAGFGDFVKLEIHPDPNYLLPDPIDTLKAAEILAKEGFKVMAYINADPVLALRLQDAGAAAVMPLGAPIGTNRGVETRGQIAVMIEQCDVPVVVDAGLGLPPMRRRK